MLTGRTVFAFYVPHASFAGRDSDLVISLSRPVNIRSDNILKQYVESSKAVLPPVESI